MMEVEINDSFVNNNFMVASEKIKLMNCKLTVTPSAVLVTKRYKKVPNNFKAMRVSKLLKSSDWTALKSTIEVASFTTPSPNTRL